LALFSSIVIHGLGRVPGIERDTPPLTLSRSQSLPLPLPRNPKNLPLPDFSSLPVPLNGYCLEVELHDKISQGRTGMVFPVKCLGITSPAGTPEPQLQVPESLCIKVAKPQFCRSLARETWAYEYMSRHDATMGVVVPQCFGMFAGRMQTSWTKVKEHDKTFASGQIPPGNGSDKEQSLESSSPSADWLKDDEGCHNSADGFSDDRTLKTQSPWDAWKPSWESDEVAVLVLEQLGRRFYTYDEEQRSPLYGLLCV
jgi:hypothetical protein